MSDEQPELVAGHPPAQKVGKRRVPEQTKRPTETTSDDPLFANLASPPNVNTSTVSGAPVKGPSDFPPEALQAAHPFKPAKNFAPHQVHNINQPRK